MDTIFALATAVGKAGVSVIRISGPAVGRAAEQLGATVPAGGRAVRRLVGAKGDFLDEALVLHFPEGRSFTGDETIELHIHGSVAVQRAVLAELAGIEGLRLAEPGEFTRRALMAGQMTLVQVEALSDLIEAETDAQRLQAQRVLGGALGEVAAQWRQDLVGIAAKLAVSIDFADEDIPVDVLSGISEQLMELRDSFLDQIKGGYAAERVRIGYEVAVLGPPNIGKSTLLNRLAGREASITSEFAGTTRDIVEVRFDLNGIPVTFLDTAGLHETEDQVEKIGISRARDRAATADLRIFLDDGTGPEADLKIAGDIVVRGKSDLNDHSDGVSGLTGEGIERLLGDIQEQLQERVASAGVMIRERHRVGLERAVECAQSAVVQIDAGMIDLAAEEVAGVLRAIDAIVGRVDVEQVLDEVFAGFCLGK